MLRSYGLNVQGLMVVLAERESVYRLLAQAKPDNLHKQTHKVYFSQYTIDPRTRYISLEMAVQPHEISHLIDTDNPRNVEANQALALRVAKAADCVSEAYIRRYFIGLFINSRFINIGSYQFQIHKHWFYVFIIIMRLLANGNYQSSLKNQIHKLADTNCGNSVTRH
uniref:N-acetylmuramoyl-L-alanine amidase n=1 Tax=Elaeophora elaphi TaxID=1147741 RepID=A0A0R3RUJ7_9BILA